MFQAASMKMAANVRKRQRSSTHNGMSGESIRLCLSADAEHPPLLPHRANERFMILNSKEEAQIAQASVLLENELMKQRHCDMYEL
jgi:hypothetical protein